LLFGGFGDDLRIAGSELAVCKLRVSSTLAAPEAHEVPAAGTAQGEANAKAGIFRLTSKVAANKHATKHGFTTFSLPLPVVLD
jgi:hypothetical protein